MKYMNCPIFNLTILTQNTETSGNNVHPSVACYVATKDAETADVCMNQYHRLQAEVAWQVLHFSTASHGNKLSSSICGTFTD